MSNGFIVVVAPHPTNVAYEPADAPWTCSACGFRVPDDRFDGQRPVSGMCCSCEWRAKGNACADCGFLFGAHTAQCSVTVARTAARWGPLAKMTARELLDALPRVGDDE